MVIPFSVSQSDFIVVNTSLYTVWSPLPAVTVTRTVPSTTPAPRSLFVIVWYSSPAVQLMAGSVVVPIGRLK